MLHLIDITLQAHPAVHITVNDEPHEVGAETTVGELLERLGLSSRYVAVERNLRIVPRRQHAECLLQPGDRLEIVTLVGGG